MDVHCENKKCKYNESGICGSAWDISIDMVDGKPVCTSCEEDDN